MADLSKLWVVVGAKTDGLKAGLQDINKDIGKSEKEWKRSFGNIEKQLTSVGTKMAVVGASISAAIGFAVKSYAEAGAAIYDMSKKTGYSTEFLSGMKYAAEQSGTAIESVATAARKLSSSIVDANEGLKTYQRAFERIGVDFRTLNNMTPENQFMTVATALSNVSDQSIKAATAQDLFGRSGTDLLPLLAEGADGIEELTKRAAELGVVFDQEAAAKAKKFDDAITDLTSSLNGLKYELGAVLSDTLKPFIDGTTDAVSAMREFTEANPLASSFLSTFAVGAAATLVSLGGIALILPKIIAGFKTLGITMGALGGTAFLGPIAAIGAGITIWGTQLLKESGDLNEKISGYRAQLAANPADLETAQKLVDALRERNKFVQQGPLLPSEKKAVEESEKLADDLQRQIDNITAAKKEWADYNQALKDNAIEECNTEIKDLNNNIKTHTSDLKQAKTDLDSLQRSYDAAGDVVKDFEQKISDANNELNKLSNPRLEGMQEYEDQIFAIDQQIKELQLQKLQTTSRGESRIFDKQIDELQKQRDILQLQSETTFDPLVRAAKEAVETQQGLNEEMTPEAVMARIKELADSLGEGGALSTGLANAQSKYASISTELNNQKTYVADIEESLEGWNEQLAAVIEKLSTLQSGGSVPEVTPDSPVIPGFANGGVVREQGLVRVGEFGPEILHLPKAASVSPLPDSKVFSDVNTSMTVVIPVNLDGQQIAEIIDRRFYDRYGVQG